MDEAVKKLASEKGGISVSDVVRQAIGTQLYIHEQTQKGCKLLLEDEDANRVVELKFL